jgi:hypothetical protein
MIILPLSCNCSDLKVSRPLKKQGDGGRSAKSQGVQNAVQDNKALVALRVV